MINLEALESLKFFKEKDKIISLFSKYGTISLTRIPEEYLEPDEEEHKKKLNIHLVLDETSEPSKWNLLELLQVKNSLAALFPTLNPTIYPKSNLCRLINIDHSTKKFAQALINNAILIEKLEPPSKAQVDREDNSLKKSAAEKITKKQFDNFKINSLTHVSAEPVLMSQAAPASKKPETKVSESKLSPAKTIK